MLLFTFILFNENLELLYLSFMAGFSLLEFLNIVNINLLFLSAASLLPGAECLVAELFVYSIGRPHKESLSKFIFFDEESP